MVCDRTDHDLYRPGRRGTAIGGPAWRPHSDRAGIWAGRVGGFFRPDAPCSGAFGVDWPAKPLPSTLVGRRSPFVLRHRGGAWPPAFGAGPGNGISHWPRDCRNVDDIRYV